jgi:hypothetical protein
LFLCDRIRFIKPMPPFLYRCPNTGYDYPEEDDTYVQVTCLACAQAQLVNPKSGKMLGSMTNGTAGF